MLPITWIPAEGANLFEDEAMLRETACRYVVDAEPAAGVLRPLRGRLTVATVPASPQRQTIYRMGRDTPNDAAYWFSWSTIVDAIRGFDKLDPTERTYFTGAAGGPQWTDNTMALGATPYPQASRQLAVPAPTAAATVTVLDAGSGGTESTIYIVHTFVNDLGWESAPSPPSEGNFVLPSAVLGISALEAAPAGNYGITARRIYQTQAGTNSATDFYFVREIPIGTTTTDNDVERLGDALATTGWLPPPSTAHSIIALWNGMFGMLNGKTALVSPEGAPYAYPVRYDIELQHTGVTCLKIQQRWLILTTGNPVMVEGADPASMLDAPLEHAWACASKRSAVSMGDGGVWASNDGLASTYRDRLLTERVVPEATWKSWNPSTMIAGRWGRFYVCSFYDGVSRRAFMMDPKAPEAGLWFLSAGFDACHYDELATELYVLEGGLVRKFAAGALMSVTATGKVFQQTAPTGFTCAKVVADAYPLTFKLYTERVHPVTNARTRVLRATKVVHNGNTFTLKHGYKAEEFQPVVEDVPGTVKAVRIAADVRQLRGA